MTCATSPLTSRMAASTSRGDTLAPGRLDHVAVAPAEVEEPVVVHRDQIARVEPVVPVEGLVPLAPEVALHEERAPEPQLAHLTGRTRRAVGSHHPRLESGHGPAERAAPVLGLLALVLAGQAHAARLGHPQHGVVAARDPPAGRSAGMIGYRLPRRMEERSRDENVGSSATWATEAANPLTMVGRSRSSTSSTPAAVGALAQTERRPGHQGAEQRVGEAADPEERRVREQDLAVVVPAQLVEIVEVPDERAVGVDARPWARSWSRRCGRSPWDRPA